MRRLHEAMVGTTHRVLIEDDNGPGENGLHKLAGRTGSNVLCELEGDPQFVGSFVSVQITQAYNRAVFGKII